MKKYVEKRTLINCIYIIVILAILFSNFFSEQLSIFLLLKPDYEFKNQTEIHFVSVGQGDAIAIKFDNGKTMLIDTGIIEYRQNLCYYLDNIVLDNSDTINYLVLTHIDADHSGNMKYILDNYKVDILYRPKILATCEDENSINSSQIYDDIISTAIRNKVELKFNVEGVSLVVGDNILTWLSPINLDDISSNDYSPVIRLDYNNHSALLTGDISYDVEEELMNNYSQQILDVDILKLAHHGSAYSNSLEFINATSPNYACVCVGKNTYGHPSNLVLERILEYDKINNTSLYTNLFSTKDNGNIIFTLKNDIAIKTISNINNYSFVDYYWYTLILSFILLIIMLTPYYKVFRKNRRFYLQNKTFEENKNKLTKE
ncbi:MAG: ComEC/Rec2 family competence protein [Christensenellales bacterium]